MSNNNKHFKVSKRPLKNVKNSSRILEDEFDHTAPGLSTSCENRNSENDPSGWTHVCTAKDLPRVNAVVDCVFPDYNTRIKCRILSRAGKTTTGDCHLLIIQEDKHDRGTCCDFKDVRWKAVSDEECTDELTVTE